MKRIVVVMVVICAVLWSSGTSAVIAQQSDGYEIAKQLVSAAKKAVDAASSSQISEGSQAFQQFKEVWKDSKRAVKKENWKAASKIESTMALVANSLLNDDRAELIKTLEQLLSTLETYEKSILVTRANESEGALTLSEYVKSLQKTKQHIQEGKIDEAKSSIEMLVQSWLTVEADVVTQSQQVYNESEQNLGLLLSYIESNPEKAVSTLQQMIDSLSPLENNAYNMWDAALIPIREGLEALLVIGSLLTITKKTNERNSSRWIWGGTMLGLAASLIIGLLVSFVLSASMFGQNNFVLAGVSGVFSSLMLLYVGYWLHSKSNIEKWNLMLQEKKNAATGSKKMVSFAFIAFLAVLREGLETVIFLIGMIGKMSTFELISGLLTGFVILFIVGVLMLKLGLRIPLKPFFLISTIIVLYMCIKFMGSGVHSLQLAGLIPSSISDHMPTISALGVFPSLYSTIPQMVIILFIIGMLIIPNVKRRSLNREGRNL